MLYLYVILDIMGNEINDVLILFTKYFIRIPLVYFLFAFIFKKWKYPVFIVYCWITFVVLISVNYFFYFFKRLFFLLKFCF
ncbi:hypothetical protein pgond44_00890 [Psychroflexus gondwanensis ACAM 44]|uniref:Uncharacterized protein n=1 Tax=Psychroflexus gondwanensis ACAM 44 TaxID=1189619 RepID=N1WQS3_9FLAO|nr:hypothetical protein pgond44_00890 [Psychroflexus gondwanensis ACAM 44]